MHAQSIFSLPNSSSITLDSGSTRHFGATSLINDTCMPHTTVTASLPNNEALHSTHEILFNYDLPLLANGWWILSHSKSSLLLVGKLFDFICTTIFKNDKAYVAQNDNNSINLIKNHRR